MRTRKTVEERIFNRSGGALSAEEAAWNVRAEYNRLARQVRKLELWNGDPECIRRKDVLALIKQAKQ